MWESYSAAWGLPTEITQSALVERDRLEQEAKRAIPLKKVETRKEILELERAQAEATQQPSHTLTHAVLPLTCRRGQSGVTKLQFCAVPGFRALLETLPDPPYAVGRGLEVNPSQIPGGV